MPKRMVKCKSCRERSARVYYHEADAELTWQCMYCEQGIKPPPSKKQQRVGQQKTTKKK